MKIHSNNHRNNHSDSLDSQIARLNIMTTEFMLRDYQCYTLTQAICRQLTIICQHPEIDFFPQQQMVYLKMMKVWQAINLSKRKTNRNPYPNDLDETKTTKKPSQVIH